MARPKSLRLDLPRIADRLSRTRSLAVASDYDGTLTPIVSHPAKAALPARTRRTLTRLARLERTRLAILSGRSLTDLARCVRLRGVFLAGAGGLETRDGAGRTEVHVRPADALPTSLREELAAWCRRFPGARFEDKRVALALHDRALSARRRRAFGAGVRRRVLRHAGRAVLLRGKRVFEVMPAVPVDKAWALDHWLAGWNTGTLAFYFGDDANDEPAHARVRRRGGVSVAVGRSASRAEYGLASPADVAWFLEWLEREWAARVRSRARPRRRAGSR